MTDESDLPEALIAIVIKRAGLLSLLSSGAIPKHHLGDELGVSRSTVYKAVRELHEHELVERTDDGLALTLTGRILEAEYATFRTTVEDVCETRQLLSILPSDSKISTALTDGATTVLAERHAPNYPIRSFEEMVENADVVRGISPVALPQYVQLFHDRAIDGTMTAELVLERPVVEHLVTDYGEELNEALASDQLSVWEMDETLPFGLIVVEGTHDGVGVVVYDDRGELRGIITNETPASMEWGMDVFESYRERATLVGGS